MIIQVAYFRNRNDLRIRLFREKRDAQKCTVDWILESMKAWQNKSGYALDEMRRAAENENWGAFLEYFDGYDWEKRLGVKLSVEERTLE